MQITFLAIYCHEYTIPHMELEAESNQLAVLWTDAITLDQYIYNGKGRTSVSTESNMFFRAIFFPVRPTETSDTVSNRLVVLSTMVDTKNVFKFGVGI